MGDKSFDQHNVPGAYNSKHRMLRSGTKKIKHIIVEGSERLRTTLSSLQSGQVADLVSGIRDAVKNYAEGAPQSDDITMLALQYKGMTAGG